MHSRSQRATAAAPRFRVAMPLALALATAFVAVTAPASSAAKAASTKSARTQTAAPAAVRTGLEAVEKQVKEFTLPNGLKFIVVERHQAPVFSFMTAVGSGSANDQIGTTGLAHMMEHMAFKGTPIVGTKDYAKEKSLLDAEGSAWTALLNERRKGARADSARLRGLEQAFKNAQESAREPVVSNEFSKIVEQAGAQGMNAFTADDMTAYFYSIPSNRLELWAVMEGSRMTYPVFREFYKERDVVYEERRMRVESSPSGRLFDEFIHAAFAAHPYGFGGIGYPSDLQTFSREQGDEYFKRNYVAKNMTVSVVGDVTLADVQNYAQKYFSDLSDAPAPPPVDTVEPEQRAERRVIIEDPAQPYVAVGWHIPAASDPSFAAYRALASLLGGGDYARLNKTLVKEKKILANVFVATGIPGERYPNLFLVVGIPAAGQDPVKVEQEIYAVLDEIQKSKPFTADELAGYKVRIKAQKIGAVDGNSDLANELAQAQVLYGDWREFFREQERVQSLQVSDLMNVMSRSLVRTNRTVGMIVNPAQAANEGGK